MSAPIPLVSVTHSWQDDLRQVITDVDELLSTLQLSRKEVGYSEAACEEFPLKVPKSFVARMKRGDPADPLLLQVLARQDEELSVAGYTDDPVGENSHVLPRKGVVHKYHGRALLIVSGGCAVNCRYCFRRHFPYDDHKNSKSDWRETLQYVRANSSITEVILSGGDPLVATDAHLAELVAQIAAIPHVQRLRIHTRLPIVIPARITEQLLQAILHPRLQCVVVLHSNHANEINEDVSAAVRSLAEAGVTVLNQSVLLAGINDSVEAQQALSETLFAAGILPYYLHLLDKVSGAAHFDIPETRAREIHAGMSAVLPGYLLPKLVREIAGEASKTVIPPLA